MMKRILRKIQNHLALKKSLRDLRSFPEASAGEDLYIIDIDNTIADTWPTLVDRSHYSSEAHRLSSLTPLPGMHDFLLELVTSEKRIVFLSARLQEHFLTTRGWLEAQGYLTQNSDLILVPRAKHKLPFLETLIEKGYQITYVDDLSYNHEHGEPLLYEEVIQRVEKLPLRYLGNEFILSRTKGLRRTAT